MSRYNIIILLLVSILSVLTGQVNSEYHTVRGYTRSDGTYVKSYKRTNRNSTVNDNYSTQGNINPWTGQAGWVPRDNGIESNSNTYYTPSPVFSNYMNYDSRKVANKEVDREIKYKDGTEIFTISYDKITSWDGGKTYYSYGGQEKGLVSGVGYVSGWLLDGTYELRYMNGNTLMKSNFSMGLLHGSRTGYNEREEIILKEKYHKGEIIEKTEFDGNMSVTHIWEVGQFDNPKMEYRENGHLQMIIEPQKDKEYVSFFDNDSRYPTRKLTFKDGQANGEFEWYFPNTIKVMRSGTYHNDKLDGAIIEFSETGERDNMYTYNSGVRSGEFVLYDDGRIIEEGSYENGFQSGLSIIYDVNGSVEAKLNYINSQVVNYILFENGEIAEEGQFVGGQKNGEAVIYDNGVLSQEVNYFEGELEGESKIYTESGYVMANYSNGDETGKWTKYQNLTEGSDYPIAYVTYDNGILNGPFWTISGDTVFIGTHRKGLRHGSFAAYLSINSFILGIPRSILDGRPEMKIEDGNYINGKRDGNWRFFSVGNSLLKTALYNDGVLDGNVSEYYPNWVDDKGVKLSYSGELRLSTTYKNGLKDGPAIAYSYLDKKFRPCDLPDESGCFVYVKINERSEFGYRAGELHGEMIVLNESGDTTRKALFLNGELNGEHYLFKDGVAVWSNYSYGKEHGEYEIIDYKRNITQNGLMYYGKKVGLWKEYLKIDDKICLVSTTDYTKIGKVKTGYDFKTGSQKFIASYNLDHIYNIQEYDDEENLVANYDFVFEDSSVIVKSHIIGKSEIIYTKRVSQLVKLMLDPGYFIINWDTSLVNDNGVLEGVQRYTNESGKVIYDRNYSNGKLNGTIIEIAGNNKELLRKAVYDDGILIGENFFNFTTQKLVTGKFVIENEEGIFEKIKLKDGIRKQ